MFLSIGKILEGSGAAYHFFETKVIASGSINKFLRRKSYSRCRSGNLLLATAMHDLHPERFVEEMNIASTNLLLELKTKQIGKICPRCPKILKIW